MKTSYKLIFNRKNKLNEKKQAPIVIECYLNRKRKYISTGIKIRQEEWNEKGQFIQKHENYIKLNQFLKKKLNDLENFELDCLAKNGTFSLDEFDTITERKVRERNSFIDFCKENLKQYQKKAVLEQHKVFVKELELFKKNLSFSDLNYNLISKFDEYLKNNSKKFHINTIAKYHKNFKVHLNIAIKKGLIQNSPYASFKVVKQKTQRTFLTIEEIQAIEDLIFDKNTEIFEQVKDMFLFSCFTGLRYSDMQNIKNSEINLNDYTFILEQLKTNTSVTINMELLFNGKGAIILKKYFNKQNTFVFPQYTNQEVNRILKIIGLHARINKNLTFHVSRHSFGTNLAKYTNDAILIKELMGHAKIDTSLIYIHLSDAVVNEKLKKINW